MAPRHLPNGFWVFIHNLPTGARPADVVSHFRESGIEITEAHISLRFFARHTTALVSVPPEQIVAAVAQCLNSARMPGKSEGLACTLWCKSPNEIQKVKNERPKETPAPVQSAQAAVS